MVAALDRLSPGWSGRRHLWLGSKPEYALLRRPPYTDAENECNAYVKEICRRSGVVWQQDDYVTDKLLNAAAVETPKPASNVPPQFEQKRCPGVAGVPHRGQEGGNA